MNAQAQKERPIPDDAASGAARRLLSARLLLAMALKDEAWALAELSGIMGETAALELEGMRVTQEREPDIDFQACFRKLAEKVGALPEELQEIVRGETTMERRVLVHVVLQAV